MHILVDKNSILNRYLADLRDVAKQTDAAKFRNNLHRIGQIIGYEISKTLEYTPIEVETPLGIASTYVPNDKIVIAAVLRAGIPLFDGLLSMFDTAESAFIAAFRAHHKDGTFDINMEYFTCPNVNNKVVIIADPLLATGTTLNLTLKKLKQYGTPKEIHVVNAIASKEGIEFFKRCHPEVHVWTCAVDEELTAKSYIVPGLGDAGDLAFGEKI